jgi:SP family arabinose:H+ symporter-like MFS transporter
MESGMGQPDLSLVCAGVNILGGLIFGVCAVGINTALSLLYPCAFELLPDTSHTWQIAALLSAVNIGAMVGALSGGEIADRIGRKWTMCIGGVLALGTIFSMFGSTYTTQFISRVITGLGVGITSSVCGAYVSEMSPPTRRGFLGALFQVSITVGILAANIICYFVLGDNRDKAAGDYCVTLAPNPQDTSMDKIRVVMIAAVAVPGAFVLLVLSPFVPESYEFVRRKDAPLVDREDQGGATMADLFKAKRPLVIALMGAVALQLTGINAVMFYCSKFLESANVSQKVLGTVIIMAWNMVTTLFSLFLADRLGRRLLLIPSLAALTIAMLLLAIVVEFTSGTTSSVCAFVLLGIYILGFEAGPGVLFWVICNEVFPESVSQKGFAFVNMIQWSFTLLVTFLFPPLQDAMGGWVFWIFGIPGVIVTVFYLFCLPETRGKTKRDITLELSSSQWVVWSREMKQVYEVQ